MQGLPYHVKGRKRVKNVSSSSLLKTQNVQRINEEARQRRWQVIHKHKNNDSSSYVQYITKLTMNAKKLWQL